MLGSQLLNMVKANIAALGTDAYILRDAVADFGPQTKATIPGTLTSKWFKIRGAWGNPERRDIRTLLMTGGQPSAVGEEREEATFSIAGDALSFTPGIGDRLIEPDGTNWAIIKVTDDTADNVVTEYVLSVRELPR